MANSLKFHLACAVLGITFVPNILFLPSTQASTQTFSEKITKKKSCCTMLHLIPRPVPGSSRSDKELSIHISRTFEYLYANDFMNAFVEGSDAVKSNPQSAIAHYLRGAALMTLLDFTEAGIEFNQALLLEPTFTDAQFMLAQSYRLSGRYDEAIFEYSKVLKDKPTFAAALALIGDCYRAQGHFWSAEAKCSEALRSDPHLPMPHTVMGYALALQDRPEQSMAEHQKAIDLAPEDPYVYFRFGQSLATMKRWAEAETALRKAIELDPQYGDATIVLSWVLSNEDKLPDALFYGKKAVLLAPFDVDAHNALALLHIKNGNHDLAVQEYKLSRSLRPKNMQIQRALAMELTHTEHIDEAIIELSLACHQFPLDEELKLALNALLQLKMKERTGQIDTGS